MLNLTDISYGIYGNNKFYMGQLIIDRGRFVVFRKWGRVGAKTPQSKTEYFSSTESAEHAFQKVFQAKSGNKWPLTEPFVRKKGKYFLVELDDGEPDGSSADTEATVEEKHAVASKLSQEVQNIVQLICDPEVVTREMASLNVDLKRFPLGKLSKAQISQGYEILQRLSAALEEIGQLSKGEAAAKTTKAGAKSRRKARAKAKGPTAATTRSLSALQAELKSLSSEFYSLIPHDFGRSLPPVIGTLADLKLKLELLEVLSNLEISQMLQKKEAKKTSGTAIHPLDMHYNMLNTSMEPLEKSGQEYTIIEKFIQKTHGGSKLNVNTILKIARPDEEAHKDVLGSLDNHMAVLLLADVALGTPYKTPSGQFLDYKMVKNERGCDSTHGLGRMAPAENEFETLPDGVVVPAGTLQPVDGNQYLLYNEFIVYRREQVQLRYLVALDFQNVACACAAKRVDPLSGCPSSAEVYQVAIVSIDPSSCMGLTVADANGVAWSFMLNYTNISFGTYGNNKFYMVQLIQDGNNYMVFRKWGRVGAKNPQRALERYNTSLEKAQASFSKKFLDKSGNEWPLTGPFERVEGKYVLVELDDEVPEEEEEISDVEKEEEVASTLHETIQDVLKLICDADLIARENAKKNAGAKLNSLDAQFNMLNVKMEPLPDSTEEFKVIERYVETTHAPTHVQYKLRIKSVLKINRPDEEMFTDVFKSVNNHKLLWHGSRLSNVVGILSKGLRVAPPEAPNNGYMFGKGIYFADSVSKSANYCWTTPQNPKGVLILAEVALGTPYKAQEAEDLTYTTLKKTKGCDSTHGVGRMAAPEDDHETMEDGVVVPIGEFMPSDGGGSLLYNEFIVYRQEQVKLRYLVNLDFLYEDEEEEV
ncbi:hypothetical protein AM588_10007803 [Phytophthora nicotianae]|uniref:Poly [ADP-ribose] polymerase n=1 Tax=Phytophthora nicotianae TaxID=4792 RepID=A0A0W8DPT6_PHYNI|nr:hypothetical protein AM588_10007803 [Phytophthora nicotianae]